MAKAQPINGLDCDASAFTGASAVLHARLNEILSFHSNASQPDGVDGVHDMRVASRRFRSALRDFSPLFEKKPLKSLKKGIKVVANALGDVRDQDVAIEALQALREKAPNEVIKAGISFLTETRGTARSGAHARLLKLVTPEAMSAIQNKLGKALSSEGGPENSSAFRVFGADAMERAHNRFLERGEKIYDPFDDNALHKLRLAAKRLRYALELFDDCWAGELKPFAKYMSKLQSGLGQVHDSSEWISYLGKEVLENNTVDRQTAAWLISEFVSLRTAEYLKALELWNEWVNSDLSSRLRTTLNK